ncbi:putative transposase [Phyllobacterium myrsinacearum]|uniref:Putative transposase n=1 Tax=Phyllobacterium myrsinacearum TaxID=28101 RepID=A0A839EQ04_9HYPH|nr:putative transposase [Phyllobacterium myrsinacearum]
MTAVCETFGVARSNIAERVKHRSAKTRGRPPLADHDLVDDIKAIIADMPTYGYRRVHAILRRKASSEKRSWPNAKRIYRVMKVHGLLLQRHTGATGTRRHDGRVAVEQSNLRWCSDGFEIGCDNKEKVRVAFALDCCDREAIAHVATTEGIKSEDVQAEAFVKTFKRDYVSVNHIPDAETVIAQLPLWFEHYNTLHPHKALGYQSPREFLNRQTEI